MRKLILPLFTQNHELLTTGLLRGVCTAEHHRWRIRLGWRGRIDGRSLRLPFELRLGVSSRPPATHLQLPAEGPETLERRRGIRLRRVVR